MLDEGIDVLEFQLANVLPREELQQTRRDRGCSTDRPVFCSGSEVREVVVPDEFEEDLFFLGLLFECVQLSKHVQSFQSGRTRRATDQLLGLGIVILDPVAVSPHVDTSHRFPSGPGHTGHNLRDSEAGRGMS